MRARTLAVRHRWGWRARCAKLVTVLLPSMALQARSIEEHNTAVGARERAARVQMGLHVSFERRRRGVTGAALSARVQVAGVEEHVTLERVAPRERQAAHFASMFGGVVVGHMSGQVLGSVERLPAVLACEHIDAIGVHITPVRMEITARSPQHGA